MQNITIQDLQSNLHRHLAAVALGEEIEVLSETDTVVARLVPASSHPLNARNGMLFGAMAGMLTENDPDWWLPDTEIAASFTGEA